MLYLFYYSMLEHVFKQNTILDLPFITCL